MELLNNDLNSFFTIWWCFPEFLLVLFISIFTGTLPFIKSEIKEWRTDNVNHYNSNTFSAICINISLVITLIAVWSVDHGTFFGGQFINDANTSFFKSLVLITGIFLVAMGPRFYKIERRQFSEYGILISLVCLGLCSLISSNDLIIFFLSIELVSLTLYILAASKNDSNYSSEAALKYFVLGAVASGILVLGISLVYHVTGSTEFGAIKLMISGFSEVTEKEALIGLALICIGLFCKLAAAPFHMWAPDVYEGVPTLILAAFATLPKIGLISILARIGFDFFAFYSVEWEYITLIVGFFSIAWGTYGGLEQVKIKRILAYSSISHVGFMIVLLGSNSFLSQVTLNFYLLAYILTTLAVATFFVSLRRIDLNVKSMKDIQASNDEMDRQASIPEFKTIHHLTQTCARISRSLCILAMLLVSLAGIPPLIGFFAKFRVFSDIIERNSFYSYSISSMILGLSIISTLYYIRIIKHIFFKAGKSPREVIVANISWPVSKIMSLASVVSISFIFAPNFYLLPLYSCTLSSVFFVL